MTIENTGTVDMTIASLSTSSSDISGKVTVDGIKVEDIIPYNNSKTFRITLEKTVTSDIKEISGLLELTFTEVVPNPNFCLDKEEIENRVANFKQIAPYTTYKEKEQLNVVGTNITSTTNDQVYFSTEKPTLNVEAALYIFSSSNSFLGRIEDYISNDTTSYYYRGDIDNNYVKFGKDDSGKDMYWRIVRINGDGSIRMIYTGTSTTATGYNTGILNRNNKTTSAFNLSSDDAAYVGYMYGLDQTYMETSSTTYLTYTNINQAYTYYFSDNVTCNDTTKDCTLTGNIISGKWSEIYETVLNGDYNNNNTPYKYTCWTTSSTDLTCGVYSEVKSYVNITQAKVRYHGYLSKDLDSMRANTYDSNIKEEIDAWYEKTFINNTAYGKDSHNVLYSSYIVDSVFCNDRSVYSGNVNSLQSTVIFWPYRRTVGLYKPSLQCGGMDEELRDERDLFTVSSAIGNGELTYPVGLLTQDEVYLAGGKMSIINPNYYLMTGSYYWLMSPSYLASSDSRSFNWFVRSTGNLLVYDSTRAIGVRPVINLRADIVITGGTGTQTKPYEIVIP